jgi:ribosomal-protein-alanine N-acetyltransferase
MITISPNARLAKSHLGEGGLSARPAVYADQRQISDLLFFESHVHRHLDWRTPLDWLGAPHYWIIEERGRIHAALACPPDPPGIAWIRLFVHSSLLSGDEAWQPLWEATRAELRAAGGATVAAIALKPWLQDLLQASGFKLHQYIVLLESTNRSLSGRALPPGLHIRPMTMADLSSIAAVDADAFDPLWRNSQATLQKAYVQAVYASVAEQAEGIVGYQISTGNPLGAHLARLGVRRVAQGRGLGELLIGDLIHWLRSRGLSRLTVNTQADNIASLKLYQKMGFARTGEVYPVFVHQA